MRRACRGRGHFHFIVEPIDDRILQPCGSGLSVRRFSQGMRHLRHPRRRAFRPCSGRVRPYVDAGPAGVAIRRCVGVEGYDQCCRVYPAVGCTVGQRDEAVVITGQQHFVTSACRSSRASSRAVCKVTVFSNVPLRPTVPGSMPPCPGSITITGFDRRTRGRAGRWWSTRRTLGAARARWFRAWAAEVPLTVASKGPSVARTRRQNRRPTSWAVSSMAFPMGLRWLQSDAALLRKNLPSVDASETISLSVVVSGVAVRAGNVAPRPIRPESRHSGRPKEPARRRPGRRSDRGEYPRRRPASRRTRRGEDVGLRPMIGRCTRNCRAAPYAVAGQRPMKRGGRFSMNAVRPSL